MIQNVQMFILVIIFKPLVATCPPSKYNNGLLEENDDNCYEMTKSYFKNWISDPQSPSTANSALFEHCDAFQAVPVTIPQTNPSFSAVVFSNTSVKTKKFQTAHLYGSHQFFENDWPQVVSTILEGNISNTLGCLFSNLESYKPYQILNCGNDGIFYNQNIPPHLHEKQFSTACGFLNGNKMLNTKLAIDVEDNEKIPKEGIYTETVITSKFGIFCDAHIFLSDVYIVDLNDTKDVKCLKNIRKIGGRFFIIHMKIKLALDFEKLEEVGENVQYGKRPIIQVVGNEIPEISFPNLKKIHCEFSTDVCVVYANNNISKFAGVYYEKVPKSDGASWVGQAPKKLNFEYALFGKPVKDDGKSYVIIGFLLVIMLILAVCSLWFLRKDNDYPPDFNMNKKSLF